jgi:short-chain fatty acids transporter
MSESTLINLKRSEVMLHRIVNRFRVGVESYIPDAFVFAMILTIVTYVMGIFIGGKGPFEMIEYWYSGFWKFLSFSMQIVVILVAGYCIALAPIVQKGIRKLASLPKNPTTAVMSIVLISGVAAYINWGFGLVLGPIFAREVSKNVKNVDYRILIAGAFCGAMSMIPASLSVTAPLLVNTPGHFLEEKIGLIPLTETILSPMLLVPAILTLVAFAIVFRLMHPKPDETIPFSGAENIEEAQSQQAATAIGNVKLADRLDNSKLLNYLLVLGGLSWIVYYFATKGFDLNLDFTNFMLIIVGMALHGTPKNYINAIQKAIPASAGIVLQFPFYAGIMGMVASSGLILVIANWFVSISSSFTLPLFTYWSACIVNIFVPSSGGQWAVQGPIMIEAASQLGIKPAAMVNAVTLGDITTNLFQPFWALPALGIAGLGIRDIWGYCLFAMIIFLSIGSFCMLIFA